MFNTAGEDGAETRIFPAGAPAPVAVLNTSAGTLIFPAGAPAVALIFPAGAPATVEVLNAPAGGDDAGALIFPAGAPATVAVLNALAADYCTQERKKTMFKQKKHICNCIVFYTYGKTVKIIYLH